MRTDLNMFSFIAAAAVSLLSALPASAQLIWYDGLGTCPAGEVLLSGGRQRYMIETTGHGDEELDFNAAVAGLNAALSDAGCSWLSVENIDSQASDTFVLNLIVEKNESGSRSVAFGTEASHLILSQEGPSHEPSARPLIVSPSDTVLIRKGEKVTVTLSGTDAGASYILVRSYDGEDIELDVIRGTGGAVSSSLVLGEGYYYLSGFPDAGGFTVIYARVPSPSMDRNWILTERLSGSQSKAYSIDYFDGVGNLVQSQEVFASEDGGADLITAHSFDHLFRETRTYSPYPLPDNYGAFDPSAEARQEAFYKGLYPQESGNGAYAWTETAHDAAPGGRVTSLTRPGKVYHEVGRSLRTAYRGNRAGEVLIVDVGVSDGALSIPGYYLQGSLACVSATDEDGRRKDTFTDLDGNVVLERRFPSEGDSSLVADTYYGYDIMGRLRIVIMPEASALLSEDGDVPDPGGLCYRYDYDSRGRVCQVTTPGADPVYLVHDKADRTVMRQDGNMRAKGQWLLLRYDGAGRLTSQELASAGTALTRDSLQAAFDSGSVPGIYSGSQATKLIEVAYDRYPSGMDEGLAFRGIEGITAMAGASLMRTNVTGLAVSERVRVLGHGESVLRAFYYDSLENLIQTVEKRPDGSVLTTSQSYDLQGRVLRRRTEWSSGSDAHTLDESMEYDARGALLGTTSMLDEHEATTRLSYDSLGRLSRADYGKGNGMITETRGWNLQGWETSRAASSRGSSLFSSVLRYDGSWNGPAGLFAGGISSWSWHHGGSPARSYTFSYDGMGRLTGAEQFDGTVKTNAHSERDITYDLNSAILSMKRSNGSAAQTFSRSYDGVRRSGLDYDANGNVTRDPGNRFSASYNILNLPERVRAEDYLDCEIVYLADGTKIRAIETQDMQAGYYYAGPFRMSYSDGAIDLESAAFSGGRFDFSGAPHYFLSDHLGSVRAVVDADGEAEAAYDYLPYGSLWSSSGTDYGNDFLFGGKERQTVLGLDLYDNAARFLSTDGSFISIDPQSSRYPHLNPYAYCASDPVNLIDPDGKDIWEIDNKGNIVKQISSKEYDMIIYLGNEPAFEMDENFYDKLTYCQMFEFDFGTINHQKDNSYDYYILRGDKTGMYLFKFLSRTTDVEWSLAQLGVKGDKGLNYITTSHEPREEDSMAHLIKTKFSNGYTARAFYHSHPGDNPNPSGGTDTIRDGKKIKAGEWGDIYFAKVVKALFGDREIPTFIYHPKSNQFIRYHGYKKDQK